MKIIFIIFISIGIAHAAWESQGEARNAIWTNPKFKNVFVTESSYFSGKRENKQKMLSLLHIQDWKVSKETKEYIIGTYKDKKNRLNFFLESKSQKSVHIITSNEEMKESLETIYREFISRKQ